MKYFWFFFIANAIIIGYLIGIFLSLKNNLQSEIERKAICLNAQRECLNITDECKKFNDFLYKQ
ncbi:MAG: hypothetical protein UT24_C0029G0006 [Candidatus Woesebacteria bacterium GW2011_GWB1_39_12]|uniref:Uncharacterized protein n=1 Tax=Candidatus Woesebacteria bacterium GW2011_GWB1_39_12 TaxID=1618574 RepID=A0A0G0PLH7_9BACT|nr:MAG: hypothetical protein UT24_C0029G0006 [Candidatus Woesebacteria bacterium GW2011_GWB1_39_12]